MQATIEDIKNFDDWDYFRLKKPITLRGVVCNKCAMAQTPMIFSNLHAVMLIDDDLGLMVLPRAKYRFMTVGNLEKVSLNNIVFGKD